MEGRSSPQDAGAWRLQRISVLAALVVTLFAVGLLGPFSAPTKHAVSGVGLIAGGLAVAASCHYRYRRADGRRRRRAWLFFGAAALLAAASNGFLLLDPPNSDQQISPGDVCLALCLLFGVAGVASFPTARRRGTDLTRMMLDGIVVGGSLMFIASVTIFPEILHTRGARGPVLLLIPVVDTVIATLAGLLFLRGARSDRRTLGLGGLGFVCYALSDFAYATAIGQSGVFVLGSIADLGWITGYVLLAWAVRDPSPRSVTPPDQPVEISPVLGTTVVFSLFLLAAGFSLTRLGNGGLGTPSAALWLLVLLGVMARQILLIIDNERLRRILEQRVLERSRSLRQVTQQSDLLVNSVGDGIYGVDAAGLVTFVNPAAALALGYPAQTLIGQDAHGTFHGPGPDGNPVPGSACYVTEAIRAGVATSAGEDIYLRADGLPIPVEVTATPLYEDGRTTGAVVVFRDVTERREMDRLKSEFVSMVSHELRTPLAAIRGSLGLIAGGAMGPLSPTAGRMVEIALLSSDRLTRLINDILDIERIESGVMPMELSDLQVPALVEEAVGQVQILAEQTEVEVEVEVERMVGRVHADPDRVVQTLLNLLGNAIKFSPARATVTVRAHQRDRFVEFAVADHGRGIPPDKLESIFGRFEQVDSSDAREKGGSGLGLAISRSIVERLGGRLWATNNPGGGSTFRFTLPASTVPGGAHRGPEADGAQLNHSRAEGAQHDHHHFERLQPEESALTTSAPPTSELSR